MKRERDEEIWRIIDNIDAMIHSDVYEEDDISDHDLNMLIVHLNEAVRELNDLYK